MSNPAISAQPTKLLVAAVASELQAFPTQIDGYLTVVTGIGKLMGAVNLTKAILANPQVTEIIVVGTAGAVDSDLAPGVYEIGTALQHDVTGMDGTVGQHVSLDTEVVISSSPVKIATGDSFVSDDLRAAQILAMGAQMVDMEAYVYGWVAREHGIPIRIYKAISDNAGDDAAGDWDDAVAACSVILWDTFQRDEGLASS